MSRRSNIGAPVSKTLYRRPIEEGQGLTCQPRETLRCCAWAVTPSADAAVMVFVHYESMEPITSAPVLPLALRGTSTVCSELQKAGNTVGNYTVREDGKNGQVEVQPTVIVRTVKKRLGRDDQEMIPMKAVTSAAHNRKRVGTDVVTLHTAGKTFEWKIANSAKAQEMVAEIMGHLT